LQREDEVLFKKVEVPSMRPRCMAHIDIVATLFYFVMLTETILASR
jgi:hypothetical protein